MEYFQTEVDEKGKTEAQVGRQHET